MKTINAKAVIQNKPEYDLSKYIVARPVDGLLWFWGTWDDLNEAMKVAKIVCGVVVEVDDEGME